LRQIINNRWFALFDLLIILVCVAIWMTQPQLGKCFILIALLPWGLRIISGRFPFKRTSLDWLIAIFLVTAWVGYWAAYDKTTAWNKVWLIMAAILFYYALAAQPKDNWHGLSILFFCMGVGVSVYYFLTHDFIAAPRKLEFVNRIGIWLMNIRPQINWMPIHPNYVAGLAAITTPFILYPALEWKKKINWRVGGFYAFVLMGLGIVFFALVMTTSRGAVMAIVSGVGVWLLWRIVNLGGIRHRIRMDAFFPSIVLIYLCGIIAFLYIGPANSGSLFSGNYYYGDGSRLELLSRSLYLLQDYPITGGGLSAFPGLYSQYLLNIPFFNVPNSHNMFLDAAIELGLLGGLSFVLMYLASIWLVSRSLAQENTNTTRVFNWILLFSLIVAVVHGMVEDYLFNGNGTILSLFLVALSVLVTQKENLGKPIISKFYRRIAGLWLVVLVLLLFLFSKNIMSTWYANLGSVLMSQVELDGFPDKGWAGSDSLSKMDDAEIALHASLHFAPENRTANQRLGMIAMLRQDFEPASEYLETAHEVAPDHRGIVKSLGYCYVWLGDFEKATLFLSRIPEAQEELDVYIWWWNTQGQAGLSDNAALALQIIDNQP
jgi:hypothetical protein